MGNTNSSNDVYCEFCERLIKPGEPITNVGDAFTVIIACAKCAEPRIDDKPIHHISRMTDITLEMNIKLYRDNWETVADAQTYISYLEEYISRLERKI